MKRNHILTIWGLVMTWGTSVSALPVTPPTQACMQARECTQTVSCGAYCCPSGATGSKEVCPDGWTYDTISKECTRAGTTTGSDGLGAYELTYGSCQPETITYPCYYISFSATTADGLQCYECATSS
ncbi:MAG: hypothetical protein K2L95_00770 [Alphaproteobacteria bacterium]|nr:hypothetical protein [Alphaproteobacteria bacterium]